MAIRSLQGELSSRQKELLDYIEEVSGHEHRMPSYREMAAALKLSAVGSVQDLVGALVEKGYLTRNGRHLLLSERRQSAVTHVPVVGVVAAGSLSEAIENNLGVTAFSSELLKTQRGRTVFALRVQGQSMVEAGILAGDLVVVQSQESYKSGDTVVVRYQEEATVKELYFQKNGDVVLRPRNSKMQDIVIASKETESLEFLGKVLAVQRML
ncbi:MAG: transcriptional repressor LexA [Bdellovibrionota bacterium]